MTIRAQAEVKLRALRQEFNGQVIRVRNGEVVTEPQESTP